MFTIPTIFTAIDRFAAPMRKMQSSLSSFTAQAQAWNVKSERYFRKMTPVFSETSKELFKYAKAATIAGGVIAGITFSATQLKNYQTQLASFRTIVSDLSDKEFDKFRLKIAEVAKQTNRSTVEVVSSFEKIAGLNADFAKTAEGIGAVSKAAITLSRASGDELGSSAENLVGIMNQFSLAANQADRTINVLAAGQAVGAASITQTAESFKNFGSVASSANITLEESVALIQTVGKFSLFGAEAGTKLRGSVLKLQQAGLGYASGQFNINDALAQANERMSKLATAKQKDAFLNKVFGAENVSTGKILLGNIKVFEDFTKGVSGTSEAQKAAKINSQTLTVAVEELTAAWVNVITTSDGVSSSMSGLTSVIKFVADNLNIIIGITIPILGFFVAWKLSIIAINAALWLHGTVVGINAALTGVLTKAIVKNQAALAAYKVVVGIVTIAQWLWNTAISAGAIAMQILMSPITLIILAIIALVAAVVIIIKKWNEWGAAMSLLLGPIGLVVGLVQAFRRNWGMITKAFSSEGILAGLRAIGVTILDVILMPLHQILKIIASLTGFDWAKSAVKDIEKFRANLGVNVATDESGNELNPAVNPKETERQYQKERDRELTNKLFGSVTIRNESSSKVESDNDLLKVVTTPTFLLE